MLADRQAHHDELLTVITSVLGPGHRVDDVWLWDVRPLTSGP